MFWVGLFVNAPTMQENILVQGDVKKMWKWFIWFTEIYFIFLHNFNIFFLFQKSYDGLPNYVCYQCAAALIKCNKLIEKSKATESALYDLFELNGEVKNNCRP